MNEKKKNEIKCVIIIIHFIYIINHFIGQKCWWVPAMLGYYFTADDQGSNRGDGPSFHTFKLYSGLYHLKLYESFLHIACLPTNLGEEFDGRRKKEERKMKISSSTSYYTHSLPRLGVLYVYEESRKCGKNCN